MSGLWTVAEVAIGVMVGAAICAFVMIWLMSRFFDRADW